jgi:hypothetical protein
MSDIPRPAPGDRFTVNGQREPRTVAKLLLVVSQTNGPTRYLVESTHGARWSLVPVELVTGEIRWFGTPLPADPDASDF